MRKRELHHYWKYLRHVKARYFFIAAVICAAFCVVALRHNNQHMAELRQTVYTADKDDTNVQAALNNLQAYVTAHMNTSLSDGNTSVYPPIQLQYTYQRLQEAQLQQVAAANTGLYTAAEDYCQKLDPTDFSGHNRVPCVEQYVEQHGVQAPPTIPTGLYQFDFISPIWSPDTAGWLVVATAALLLTTPVIFFTQWHFKKLLQ